MLSNDDCVTQINNGAVGILPTDTVYGLVCSASEPSAVTRLYALKSRESKPGTVIAADIDQLITLGIPRRYFRAAEQFWPNPISVVIPVGPNLDYLHQHKGSLAVRIPNDTKLHDLLVQTGPLLTTSANQPGEPPANTIDEAKHYFNDDVDFYVDGGDLTNNKPSTIIKIVDDAIEVLRAGSVSISDSGEITS